MSNRDGADPEHLVWEAPPAEAFTQTYWSKWTLVAAKLRARPGQWAKLPTEDQKNPRAFAASIKHGAVKAWRPKGAFEAVFDGTSVYARYVGEDS